MELDPSLAHRYMGSSCVKAGTTLPHFRFRILRRVQSLLPSARLLESAAGAVAASQHSGAADEALQVPGSGMGTRLGIGGAPWVPPLAPAAPRQEQRCIPVSESIEARCGPCDEPPHQGPLGLDVPAGITIQLSMVLVLLQCVFWCPAVLAVLALMSLRAPQVFSGRFDVSAGLDC
ncbi:hypothetical protein NDU88_000438 [Pleurodeles waltl]|uniref:Uncharacterized protein n=1 Tax=Pleurodeles waltl TaxID=8319 RepID=A0AAV7LUL8_PLEWA|nr:hypothetical protein NDU88_000438 [Pleurodeles waltl]